MFRINRDRPKERINRSSRRTHTLRSTRSTHSKKPTRSPSLSPSRSPSPLIQQGEIPTSHVFFEVNSTEKTISPKPNSPQFDTEKTPEIQHEIVMSESGTDNDVEMEIALLDCRSDEEIHQIRTAMCERLYSWANAYVRVESERKEGGEREEGVNM
jgi:hypothetical protein